MTETATPVAPLPVKGRALAEAVRAELLVELNVREYVTLDSLSKLCQLAHHGRLLVGVRNPMTRFEARASGQGVSAVPQPGGYGVIPNVTPASSCGIIEDESWGHGSMARHLKEQYQAEVNKAMQESPMARALRAELLEIVEAELFGPTEILEVEQLATHGISVLQARMGGPGRPEPGYQRGGGGAYPLGLGYGSSNAFAPASSQETFGAAAIRALGAAAKTAPDQVETVKAIAVAEEAGLDDVAADLRAQLKPATPAAKEQA